MPIDEKHSTSGFNPYCQSKLIGEALCESYFNDFGVPIVVLRPFNVYGLGQSDSFLISLIIKQISNHGKISLKSSKPKRDFVYIDDVVDAYYKAVEYKNNDYSTFNIGSGESYSVKEITEMIVANYKNSISIEFSEESRANEVMDTISDISKAKKLLQWEPYITLEKGIKLMLQKNDD